MANAPLAIYTYIYNNMGFPIGSAVAGSLDDVYIPKDMPVNYRLIKTIDEKAGTPVNKPLCIQVDVAKTVTEMVDGREVEFELGLKLVGGKWTEVKMIDHPDATPLVEKKKKPIIVVDMYDSLKSKDGRLINYTPRLGLDSFRALPQQVKGMSCWQISQYFDLYDMGLSQGNPRRELDAIKQLFEYYAHKLGLLDVWFKNQKLTVYGVELEEYLIRSATEAFFTDRNYQGSNESNNIFGDTVIVGSLHYTFKVSEDDTLLAPK